MASPDLSEFMTLQTPPRKPCQVAAAREQLDKPAREQLDAALAADSNEIRNAAIIKWLQKRGHRASSPAVTNHRRGTCKCHEPA